uniref:C2H2-type domain-containing protein n=1 Tax=Tetranychus urticae TaxID=32264 RepID=T1KNS4_TETUR
MSSSLVNSSQDDSNELSSISISSRNRRKQAQPRSFKQDLSQGITAKDTLDIYTTIDENNIDQESRKKVDLKDYESESGLSESSSMESLNSEEFESSCNSDDIQLACSIGESSHQCQYCDKAFPRLSYLKRHEQNHSELMPFICNYCQRTFKHKRSRDRHVKIHTGDRRYKCNHCDSAFARSDHLKTHMKTHDDMKPHRCYPCNRGFSSSAALTSHIQTHKQTTVKVQSTDMVEYNNSGENKKHEDISTSNSIVQPDERSDNLDSSNLQNRHVNLNNDQQQQQVTCGLCGNKCTSLDTHIRESHLHHLLFAGLLQNSFYGASIANWQQLMPSPTTPGLVAAAAAAVAASSSSSSSTSSSSPTTNTCNNLNQNHQFNENLKNGQYLVQQSKSKSFPPKASSSSPNHNCDSKVNSSPYCSSNDSNIPFLCNQCSPSPSFPDFESFRVHLKSHLLASSSSSSSSSLSSLSPGSLPTNLDLLNPILGPSMIHGHHNLPRHQQRSCPYCETIVTSDLENHIISSHLASTVSSFTCESCKKVFTKSDDLTKHLMDYHSHHLYQCSICREMFDTDVTLQVHFAVKHSNQCKVFKCSICNELWPNEKDFKVHLKVAHFSTPSLVNHHNLAHQHQHQHQTTNGVHPYSPSAYRHLPSSLVTSTSNSNNGNNTNPHHNLTVNSLTAAAAAFQLFGPKAYFKCQFCSDEFHIEYLLEKHIEFVHGSQISSHSLPYNQMKRSSPKIVSPRLNESKKRKSDSTNGNDDINVDDDDIDDEKDVDEDIVDTSNDHKDIETINDKESSSSPTKLRIIESPKPSTPSTSETLTATTVTSSSSPPVTVASSSILAKTGKSPMKLTGNGKGPATKCNICDEICGSISDLVEHKLKRHNVFGKSSSPLSRCLQCFETIKSENDFINHLIDHCNNKSSPVSSTSSKLTYSSIQPSKPLKTMDDLIRNGLTKFPISCIVCKQTLLRPLEVAIHAKYHCSSSSVSTITSSVAPSKETMKPAIKVKSQMIGKQEVFASKNEPFDELINCSLNNHLESPKSKVDVEREAKNESIEEEPLSLITVNQDDNDERRTKTSSPNTHQCIKCQQSFPTKSEIQSHIIAHINQESNTIKCQLCGDKKDSPAKLQVHLIKHDCKDNQFDCSICLINQQSPVNLQIHMFSQHFNQKQFNCSHCSQRFWFASELENHEMVEHCNDSQTSPVSPTGDEGQIEKQDHNENGIKLNDIDSGISHQSDGNFITFKP